MGVLQRVVKPRNQRSKRALEDREPKAIENNKGCLFIRGPNCTPKVLQCMKDLQSFKKPDCDFYGQKNDIRPFEDMSKVEFFSKKHDSSLFALGNSNKKRPDNLILGRLYEHRQGLILISQDTLVRFSFWRSEVSLSSAAYFSVCIQLN